jgi:hypothetical protein
MGPGFRLRAWRRKIVQRHARPRDSLKQGPALTLPNKSLFYYKHYAIEEGILEPKTDCFAKDLMFFACIAFCVITFEPIMI